MTVQEEKAFSEEASSLVNTAYSTLKSPLDRATYLVRSAATPETVFSSMMSPPCLHETGPTAQKCWCMMQWSTPINAEKQKGVYSFHRLLECNWAERVTGAGQGDS